MKWFILENVILLLALIAYLLMRDPKKGAPKRPGSVGIHGVNGKNKIGRDDSVDESVETPARRPRPPPNSRRSLRRVPRRRPTR